MQQNPYEPPQDEPKPKHNSKRSSSFYKFGIPGYICVILAIVAILFSIYFLYNFLCLLGVLGRVDILFTNLARLGKPRYLILPQGGGIICGGSS